MGKHPKTSKGSKRLYEVNATVWFDMLGYGSMLEKVNFDPTKVEAQNALKRLNSFHEIAAKHACKHFPIHAINDGIIAFKDLSPRAKSVTFDFVDRALKLFEEFNKIDTQDGFPGARMIIATGFRVRIPRTLPEVTNGKLKSIKKRISENVMSTEQAIREAYETRPYFGLLPELQANFAFTKAYLVDSNGSKGGFGGPNCFIDLSLFKSSEIEWLKFEKIIDWEQMGMKSKFGQIKEYNRELANKQSHNGLLDAFEVATNISSQNNITNVLRKNTIINN